jgi:hypothetical protein
MKPAFEDISAAIVEISESEKLTEDEGEEDEDDN